MPFLTLKNVSITDVNGVSFNHQSGTVLSDWEVPEDLQKKIAAGSQWYRGRFEPLTADEATRHRVKATTAAGPRVVGGDVVDPPFEDYVGLHPEEIVERLRAAPLETTVQARLYERGGMRRPAIVNFVHPAEREPWVGYDDLGVREVAAKLDVLSDADVRDVITYESTHGRRPAVITYEREPAPATVFDEGNGDAGQQSGVELVAS